MDTITVTSSRAKLYKLVDETVSSHKPVIIKGKRGNAVLLSESDWNAVSETLHLLSTLRRGADRQDYPVMDTLRVSSSAPSLLL